MAYADFTLKTTEENLGITPLRGDLFPGITPTLVPPWLQEVLAKGMDLALLTEKARSEFIVGPILLACRELSQNAVSIFSGERLDVDPKRGLVGECDFVLAMGPPIPLLRAPLMVILEAKRNDIELGLGQCVAQMVGARLFNENSRWSLTTIFGCVTTGEDWQFLRLRAQDVEIDRKRYYLSNLGEILAIFHSIISQGCAEARKAG